MIASAGARTCPWYVSISALVPRPSASDFLGRVFGLPNEALRFKGELFACSACALEKVGCRLAGAGSGGRCILSRAISIASDRDINDELSARAIDSHTERVKWTESHAKGDGIFKFRRMKPSFE